MSRLLSELRRRIQLVASLCVLRSVKDDQGVQATQVTLLAGETRELRRMQHYGFTSHPHPNRTEGVALFLGGNRDNGVVVATEDREARDYPLKEGEVALYTSEGDVIELRRGHEIYVQANGGRVHIAAPEVRIDGNLEVAGSVTVGGSLTAGEDVEAIGHIRDLAETVGLTMDEMRQIYDVHTHIETDTVTAPPVPPMGGG